MQESKKKTQVSVCCVLGHACIQTQKSLDPSYLCQDMVLAPPCSPTCAICGKSAIVYNNSFISAAIATSSPRIQHWKLALLCAFLAQHFQITVLGGPYNQDYDILGSILRFPYFGDIFGTVGSLHSSFHQRQ